jgi:hypothetical protein
LITFWSKLDKRTRFRIQIGIGGALFFVSLGFYLADGAEALWKGLGLLSFVFGLGAAETLRGK